jgi:hypothetical protein
MKSLHAFQWIRILRSDPLQERRMLAGDAQPAGSNQNFDQQTRARMIGFLKACVMRARRVRERILAIERHLDDLLVDVEAVEEGASVLLLVARDAREGAGTGEELDTTGASDPYPVARSLILARRPDKFFDVRIDFAKETFAVQQQLGLFLKLISDGEPTGSGGLVGYRTEKELIDGLKEIGSRTTNPHKYIGNLVNALKDALETAGYSRHYVQRNSHGVRFRRLKQSASVPGLGGPFGVVRT